MTEQNAEPPPPPPLHELEAKVMAAIWAHTSTTVTVRDILDIVNARENKPLAYTTIMTIMVRLHRKGILARELDGRTNVYHARYSREQYMEARAAGEVQALVNEFGETALLHFTRQVQNLDPKRREALRRIARRD
ncbi:MAG: BlaI/MecI/CopY family transcriptional regulator [Solirubrobacteraceae bacterium]|nr:BlaI/MecI/CopY family transcriptional regulator [Solirubrobacteraceae bacterium]